jgi:LTXXQ motif family protein
MSAARGIFVVTMLLLCAAVPAGAQDAPQHGSSANSAPQTAGDQPAMMSMTSMSRHTEGWLAFLRTELKITEAQAGVWGDFAASIRANVKRMSDSHASMNHQNAASPSLPERLLAQEQMMAGQLAAMRRMREAIESLYAVLSGAQKKVADELLDPQGMM